MIDYQYRLERDEGDEKKIYRPDKIPGSLPNVVYIEGPNSSGKSTLLNVLALAFHGMKLEKMNPALRSRMKSLIESPHQDLDFEVKITGKDNALVLLSKKDSPKKMEIVVREYEDGKPTILIPEQFHKKYNLIYDIPDDPTERLDQLIVEIKNIQRMYGIDVATLRNHIHGIIGQIRSSRDPAVIKKLKDTIAKSDIDLEEERIRLSNAEAFVDRLERFTFARLLQEKNAERYSISEKLKAEDSRREESGKKQVRKDTKYEKKREEVREIINDIGSLHRDVASLLRPIIPRDEKQHLDVWEGISFVYAISDGELNPSLRREITALKRILQDFLRGDAKDKVIEAKVFSALIDLLSNYRSSTVVIPGLDKSINEFIEILEDSRKSNKRYEDLSKTIQLIESRLDELEELRNTADIALFELKKLRKDREIDEGGRGGTDEIEGVTSRLAERLKAVEKECNFYHMECAKKGIDDNDTGSILKQLGMDKALAPYLDHSDKDLENALDDKRERLLKLRKGVEAASTQLEFNKGELTRLEKKEPHKYQDKVPILEELFRRCQTLEQRLTKQYDGYLSTLSGKSDVGTKSQEESKYFSEVSKFLAKKLGTVRHLETDYKVTKVDMIAREISTEGGKIIRFSDMGTGQAQSAYLTGLLHADDKRKIIVLFDEVAMMDTMSLEPVYRSLRQLYEKDRLLLGVVVQKGDHTKITPLV